MPTPFGRFICILQGGSFGSGSNITDTLGHVFQTRTNTSCLI